MAVALELTFRHMEKSESLDALARELADKLRRFNDHITSIQVAIELEHTSGGLDNKFRVRIDARVAGGKEVVVQEHSDRQGLHGAVRAAFHNAGRKLAKVSSAQHGQVKAHPEQDMHGVIRLLRQDYGFVLTEDGMDVYFHRNSVVSPRFEELAVGMGVTYTEEPGEQGPQASSLRVVDSRTTRRNSQRPAAE